MELTLDQALQKGIEAHKSGQIQEADRLYTAILKAQPKHPDANHNMGMLAVGIGKVQDALPFFKTALEASPSIPQFYFSYIDTLIKLERLNEAKEVFDQAKQKTTEQVDFVNLCKRLFELHPDHFEIDQIPKVPEPPSNKLQVLIKLYNNGQIQEALGELSQLIRRFPSSAILYNLNGACLADIGQIDSAIESYNKALLIDPDYADVHNNLGNILKDQDKLDEAIDAYNKALLIKPDYAEAWNNIGIALTNRGDLEEAVGSYNKAININPDYADAYNNKGVALHKQGKLVDAVHSYNKLISVKADSASAYNNLGSVLHEQEKLEEALDAFNKAISLKPDYADAYNNLGISLQKLEMFVESLEALNKALEIQPDYADALNNIGVAFYEMGELKNAVEAYKKVVSLSPDYAEAWNNMGLSLAKNGELKAAVEAYKKAINLKPDYSIAYNNLGVSLKNKGNLKQAIEAYNKAIDLQPDYVDAYLNLSISLRKQGKLKKAVTACKMVITLKPGHFEANNNMGLSLKDQGNSEEALGAFKNALSIKPNCPETHNNIGNLFLAQGDIQEAKIAYGKALFFRPNYAEAINNMGNALLAQGHLKDATSAFSKAIELKPEYCEAYNNLGVSLKNYGDLQGAIEAFKKAISLKPDYAEAWNNIYFPLQGIKINLDSEDKIAAFYPNGNNSDYGQIAKSILHYKLHSGQSSSERCLNEALALLSNANNLVTKNPKQSAGLRQGTPVLVNSPVALVCFGRSGTGLLHSLIDGHPEVSSFPSIYFSEYFDYATWVKINSAGWDEMVDNFIAIYEVLFDANSIVPIEGKSKQLLRKIGQKEGMANVGYQRNEVLKVEKNLFRSELIRLINVHKEVNAFLLFELAHAAYEVAINSQNKKSLIFYHIHNPDNYAQINFMSSAPSAKWIVMVRDPLQSCESWLTTSFNKNDYGEITNKIISMLFEVNNIIYHRQRSIGIRLEDLKEYPRKIIPALCEWMGIGETESLYEMTAQGKKWWGDPSSPDFEKDGMNPFGKSSVNREIGTIFSERDQFTLKTLFYPFSQRFGYVKENPKQFSSDLDAIRPMFYELFDFEKKIIARTKADIEKFQKSGSYLFFRSGLIERWNTLNKFHTYPNMITPLRFVKGF